MIFADKHPKTISHLLTVSKNLRFLNVKALVGAFNKEKALVGAFYGTVKFREGSLTALLTSLPCAGT